MQFASSSTLSILRLQDHHIPHSSHTARSLWKTDTQTRKRGRWEEAHLKDLLCRQAVSDKGRPSWQGQNGKTAYKGIWQPRCLMGGGARREDTKAKLLLSPSPPPPTPDRDDLAVREPGNISQQEGRVLVSPSLLTWYIVQDRKEAPKVSALKFLHPIVSTGYGGWLLLVFPPFLPP